MDVDLIIELMARKAVEAMGEGMKAGRATNYALAHEKQIESKVLNDLRKEIQTLLEEERNPAGRKSKLVTTVSMPTTDFASGYEFSIDPALTPGQIDKILTKFSGVPGQMFRISDDPSKVRFSWHFMVDGKHCAIWDFNRTRWSAAGPKECFEAIGMRIVDQMAKAPSIEPVSSYVASHKQWSLDSKLSLENINHALKRKIRKEGNSGDGKVKHRWEFTVDGEECAIWDYYGARWSAYGPKEALEKLGFKVYPA